MNAIETFALEKTYLAGFWRKRPKTALEPLTLTVPEGEVFGYRGLFVADGSLIPVPLGCPPSMTIAAAAERVAEGIVAA